MRLARVRRLSAGSVGPMMLACAIVLYVALALLLLAAALALSVL